MLPFEFLTLSLWKTRVCNRRSLDFFLLFWKDPGDYSSVSFYLGWRQPAPRGGKAAVLIESQGEGATESGLRVRTRVTVLLSARGGEQRLLRIT